MSRFVDLYLVYQLDVQIRQRATGIPEELAKKLAISVFTLHFTIAYLKDEMRAPIIFNKKKNTYEYEYPPKFYIGNIEILLYSQEPEKKSKGSGTNFRDSNF